MQYITYDWFRDIWIPLLGAVLIPLTIAFFTWFFGASRAEKQKENDTNISNINYLKSIVYHTIIDLLTLWNATERKKKILDNFYNTTIEERIWLFSSLSFQDVYTQIEEEKYAKYTMQNKLFLFDLIEVKRIMKDLSATLNIANNLYLEKREDSELTLLLKAIEYNLPLVSGKTALIIDRLQVLINDIKIIEDQLKLDNVIDVKFSEEEIVQINKTKEDLHSFMRKLNTPKEQGNDK